MEPLNYGKRESANFGKVYGRIGAVCLLITITGFFPAWIPSWLPSFIQNCLGGVMCASLPIGGICSLAASARPSQRTAFGWIAFVGYCSYGLYILIVLKIYGGPP